MANKQTKSKAQRVYGSPVERWVLDTMLAPGEKGSGMFRTGIWYTILPEGGFTVPTDGEAQVTPDVAFSETALKIRRLICEITAEWEQDNPGHRWVYVLSRMRRGKVGYVRRISPWG